MRRHADVEIGFQIDFHDHRLDEHLPAADVEALDHLDQVAVVGLRGDHHQRVGVLVRGDLHLAGKQVRADRPGRRRGSPGGSGRPRRAAGGGGVPRRRSLRERLQRRGDVLRLGILQVIDVNSAFAGGNVELADQLQHARKRSGAGDDDELVRPLLRDDLPDLHRPRGGGRDLSRRRHRDGLSGLDDGLGDAELPHHPTFRTGRLGLEDLGQLLRQLLCSRVVHGDDVDLLGPARLVELLDEFFQAAHVETEVADHQRVRRKDLEIGVARGELVQHVAHLVRFDVAELEQLGHHLFGRRRFLPPLEVDGDVGARRLLLLHQFPILAHRVDGPVVRVEGGDEHVPHVLRGNRGVREDGDLPRHALRQDEVALRELAHELDHFGEVPLVEGHHHRARAGADLLLVQRSDRARLGRARGRRRRGLVRRRPGRLRGLGRGRARRCQLTGTARRLRLRARCRCGDERRGQREQGSPARVVHEILPVHSME